jgi:hypothetical protein
MRLVPLVSSPAQRPPPFPRAGGRQTAPPSAPATQAPATQAPATPATDDSIPLPATADPRAPSEEELGFPVYPPAQYLASYDAGQEQHYHLYGTTATFDDIVNYYQAVLDERGRLVFREPPTQMFEIGRFREETMAFPPGVTVKDWTWGGSQGYPHPGADGLERFPTIIMIVPRQPGARD